MKEIELTQGQVALVDDEDYDRLKPFNWFAKYNKHTQSFYAGRATTKANGRKTTLSMHRFIMDAPCDMQVDHQSHNTLDNRKDNLRLATNQVNMKNQQRYRNNTSGVCGVHWYWRSQKWVACIYVNNKRIHLGYFTDKSDAIAAREEACVRYGFHENHGKPIDNQVELSDTLKSNWRNVRLRSNNLSGVCGVSWNKQRSLWRARIYVNGKEIPIGHFHDKDEAIAARQAANITYGFHENHGKKGTM